MSCKKLMCFVLVSFWLPQKVYENKVFNEWESLRQGVNKRNVRDLWSIGYSGKMLFFLSNIALHYLETGNYVQLQLLTLIPN